MIVTKKRKFEMAEFQVEDLQYLSELDKSANWSEMGCFKTTTAEWLISLKTKDIENPRVLVITTKSGKGTYLESLPELMKDWEVYNVGTKRTHVVINGRPMPLPVEIPTPLHNKPVVVLAHYHCFTNRACVPREVKDPDTGLPMVENGVFKMHIPRCYELLRHHWDFIILDEAHRIKDRDAQWSVNIKRLKATYKHVMTGTGFINNPAEIWNLLHWLYPTQYSSRDKFVDHFCMVEDVGGYKRITGIDPKTKDEFRELTRKVGVRRTMIEAFPNIPEPIVTRLPVSLNKTQKVMYDEIRDELRTMDQKGEPIFSPNVLSALNRLRQICVATPEVIDDYYDAAQDRRIIKVKLVEPSSKLDTVMEILDGMEWDEERRDQVVVFSAFRDPLELLKKRLDKKNIPYLHMEQKHNDDTRYRMWHDTWPKAEHQVFLTTLQLGSESINLTSAHRAIFLDRSWSPKDNTQAIGRVYRPGQTEPCQLIYIEAINTVDGRMFQTNEMKVGWFKEIFGEEAESEDSDAESD